MVDLTNKASIIRQSTLLWHKLAATYRLQITLDNNNLYHLTAEQIGQVDHILQAAKRARDDVISLYNILKYLDRNAFATASRAVSAAHAGAEEVYEDASSTNPKSLRIL